MIQPKFSNAISSRALRFFLRMWNESGAVASDFARVSALVRSQVSEALGAAELKRSVSVVEGGTSGAVPITDAVEVTTDGADRLIDDLAKKYTGAERYGFRRPGEVRVTLKIAPDKVNELGLA